MLQAAELALDGDAAGLPLAWQVRTARRNESLFVAPLIEAVRARGFEPRTVAMDRGYDNNRVMDETRERGCVPIVALRKGRPIPLTQIPYGSPEWKRLYHQGAFELLTSMVSQTEVAFGRAEQEEGAPDEATLDEIAAFWLPGSPVQVVEFHRLIAETARDFVREARLERNERITPLDAIHLATAQHMGRLSSVRTINAC